MVFVWLAIWLCVQPWLLWPQLLPDVSHRLTLVVCEVGVGLWAACRDALTWPLPRAWVRAALACLAVMVAHQWPVIQAGTYFSLFQETALFCDGALIVLATVWGLWGLLQVPVEWSRRMRWAALGMILLNLLYVLLQATGHHVNLGSGMTMPYTLPSQVGQLTGVMGYDRLLGAYGVAWWSILWAWSPWLTLLPLALIVASHKVSAWLGLGVCIWRAVPRFRWPMLGMVMIGAIRLTDGVLRTKLLGRLSMWRFMFRQSLVHPWVGWGWSPLLPPQVVQQAAVRMIPPFHNDWLLLAFSGGWIVTGLMAWSVWSMLRDTALTSWARACQTSVLALSVMAMGQSVVSHPRIAGLLILVVAWFYVEQRTAKESTA